MKRLIPLGTVLVLVVTACGAGAKPAPQALEVSTRVPRSVHAIVAARRRTAAREAERLLHRFVPPRGATRLSHPPAAGPLVYPGLETPEYAELVARHSFWQVDAPFADVVASVNAHRLRGFDWAGTSRSTGVSGPPYTAFDFDGPGHRQLSVTVVRLSGRTVLRVDAAAVWIYPRSPREVVPRGAHRVDIHGPAVSVRVTRATRVARIVRWFDALDVVQPGVTIHCGVIRATPSVTFDFRTRRGVRLAEARAPARGYSSLCDPIRFGLGRRSEPRLIGANFVARVARLLSVRFSSRG